MTFASTLNTRISIMRRTTGQDETGQPTDTWTEFAAPWSAARGTGGMEAIRAGAVTATQQASFRIRARADLTTADRVVSEGVTYEIKALLPDLMRNMHLDIVCEAIA